MNTNYISCRDFLDHSFEIADFCINYNKNESHKVFYLNAFVCIELLLKNLIIFKIYNDNDTKTVKQLLEEVSDFNQNVVNGFIEGLEKIDLDKQTEVQHQLFKRLVKSKLKAYRHDLIKLFNFDTELKNELELESVECISNEFVSSFRLRLNSGQVIIMPTLEAIRYHAFSNEQTVFDIKDLANFSKLQGMIKKIKEFIQAKVKYNS